VLAGPHDDRGALRRNLRGRGPLAVVMRTALGVAVVVLAGTAATGGGARASVLASWDVPASDFVPSEGVNVVGPVLAGDRVVWARGSLFGTWTLTAAPGGTLARLPMPDGTAKGTSAFHRLTLAGSPTRLALLEQREDPGTKYDPSRVRYGRVAAGPAGGVPATVAECRADTEISGLTHVGLAGDVLAFDDACASGEVHATDLVSGTAWTRPGTLAYGGTAAGQTVVVGGAPYDAASGAPRPPYPALASSEDQVIDQGVQDDGTQVALVQHPTGPATVVLRTPAAAAAAAVPLDRPLVGATNTLDPGIGPWVRIAGGRLAVRVAGGAGGQLLAVAGPDGTTTPVVAFGHATAIHPEATPMSWSYDGTRIAWAALQCDRITVGVSAVDGPVEAVPQAVCARPRVISRVARISRSRRFALRMTCGAPCRGKLVLDFGGFPARTLVVPFALPGAPRAQTVWTRLPQALRRRTVFTVHVHGDPESVLRTVTLRGPASTPGTAAARGR
jgi:hypothetical protein